MTRSHYADYLALLDADEFYTECLRALLHYRRFQDDKSAEATLDLCCAESQKPSRAGVWDRVVDAANEHKRRLRDGNAAALERLSPGSLKKREDQ